MSNQPCLARSTLVDFNRNEICHYPFTVSSDRGSGSCNNFGDPCTMLFDLHDKICAPGKT